MDHTLFMRSILVVQEDFTNNEANDPWVQNFIVNLDSLLVTFKVGSLQK